MVRVMIVDGKYTLREGRSGDRPASNFLVVGSENIPDYVLLYQNEQIGAVHRGVDFIFFIEIFDPHKGKGHGTKFIEMLEREAKRIGESEISAFPVTNERLEHILENKRGWTLVEEKNGDKKYLKKL